MCSADVFLGLLAILFPPLPVWVKCGICSADSIINILLCMLGYIPGLLHAWYIIAKFPDRDYAHGADSEHGRVAYIVVSQDAQNSSGRQPQQQRPQRPQRPQRHQKSAQQPPAHQPQPEGCMSYGTTQASNADTPSTSSSAPPQPSRGHVEEGGCGSSDGLLPPPSYSQVMGDHKIQDQGTNH